MQLSPLELSILNQLSKGNNTISSITNNLNKDKSRIYRAKQHLINKEFITFSKKTLKPKITPHITLLLQLLSDHPQMIPVFADSGLPLLTHLITPKTIKDLQQQTNYQKSMIYKKINQAKQYNIITKKQNTYQINQKIWPDLFTFLKELHTYEQTTDPRIPPGSKIYHKTKDEILFSTKQDIDATKTAFSAYPNHGISLLLPTNYYILPKQSLSKKKILIHSLTLTKREHTIRNITFVTLFYLKYKKQINHINHPILENIEKILQGQTIPGYPKKQEIVDKAEVYDIRI